MRWDSAVEKVWKDTRGKQEDIISAEESGRYKTEEVDETIKISERLTLRNKVESEKH